MYELSIQSEFSAAHRLAGYDGKCRQIHGHNWGVEIGVQGTTLDEQGILVDFKVLRGHLAAVLEELDHKDLNEVAAFAGGNPTAENIARFIYERLEPRLADTRCRMAWVAVRETPRACARYTRGGLA